MRQNTLHERLNTAAGDRTVRAIATMTSTPPETVRRYMTGTTPSAEFMSAICHKLRINGDWLLSGRGPMRLDQLRRYSLEQADPTELLTAMAQTIELLSTKVERLERFVQTQEVRLRAKVESEASDGERTGDAGTQRGRRVADAIPKRPPQALD